MSPPVMGQRAIAEAWMTGECNLYEAMLMLDVPAGPDDVRRTDERALCELGEDLFLALRDGGAP